jgi:hypothetical protein
MPRQAGAAVTNNFAGGLITENTSLNFPENACTETLNCVFDIKGNVYRRKGFRPEVGGSTRTIDRTGDIVSKFIWKNAGGEGDINLVVVQVGDTLYFYKAGVTPNLSDSPIANTINLTTYSPSGAPSPATVACQYASGLGKLFVTHPYLESFTVAYNPTTETFTNTQINLRIRDFEGVDDSLDVTARPTTLSDSHKYNLLNQGWTTGGQVYTSTTSINYIGTPPSSGWDITFTIASGQTITVGETMSAYFGYDFSKGFTGTVFSYSGTSLRITGASSMGGTNVTGVTDWILARELPALQRWNRGLGNYPSNADVWWQFKDSTDAFNHTMVAKMPVSTRKAPKGRFILNLYNQNRVSASGVPNVPSFSTGYQRASTCAFFAGRVFYSGIDYVGVNSRVYFSQIIEEDNEYGDCFQKNDPTSEAFYDLLPTDGGVIDLQDAGTIIKLFTMKDGLVVFATNGIWYITGSTGLGFTANDFAVLKISEIYSTSATSFINAQGIPFWWNNDGIWTLGTSEQGGMAATSLTDQKIKSFYVNIPITSRRNSKGYFNPLNKTLQWLYKSTDATTPEELQEFDKILCFDLRLGAFYVWDIGESDTKINDIVVVDTPGSQITVDNVVDDNGDNVIDDDGNNVIVYNINPGISEPRFKYVISTPNGSGSYLFTFGEEADPSYHDWPETENVNYISNFVTGYKIRGEAQKKFQSNYVYIFSDADEDTKFYFQGIRNFALQGSTGKFGSKQLVYNTPVNYDTTYKRLKVRGHGLALQFKVESLEGFPFNIIGWSEFITGNQNI